MAPPVGPRPRPDVVLPPGTHLLFAQSGRIDHIPLEAYDMKKEEAKAVLHLPVSFFNKTFHLVSLRSSSKQSRVFTTFRFSKINQSSSRTGIISCYIRSGSVQLLGQNLRSYCRIPIRSLHLGLTFYCSHMVASALMTNISLRCFQPAGPRFGLTANAGFLTQIVCVYV